MEFQREPGRIYAEEEGRVIAEVTFPDRDGAADIDHTFVDDTLRGQGVAGQLLREAADVSRHHPGDDGLSVPGDCLWPFDAVQGVWAGMVRPHERHRLWGQHAVCGRHAADHGL